MKAKFVWRKLRKVEEDGEVWHEVADEQEVILSANTPLELYVEMQKMIEQFKKDGYVIHSSKFEYLRGVGHD